MNDQMEIVYTMQWHPGQGAWRIGGWVMTGKGKRIDWIDLIPGCATEFPLGEQIKALWLKATTNLIIREAL